MISDYIFNYYRDRNNHLSNLQLTKEKTVADSSNINLVLTSKSEMDEYIQQATMLESRDIPTIAARFSTQRHVRLLHAAMGLVTESAETLDVMKKYLFYGKEADTVNLREEAGDVMWYLAVLFDEMGWSFEEVARINIAKLKLRYPDKFQAERALSRDLTAERTMLEQRQVTVSESD